MDRLLEAIAEPVELPLQSVEMIVPSLAIQRRIELDAAQRYGICANVQFSFLARWLWRQIALLIKVADDSPFQTPRLAWRIYSIFGENSFVARYPSLERYLQNADPVMRHELALRAASLMEQYLAYRPDWLSAWLESGVEEDKSQESAYAPNGLVQSEAATHPAVTSAGTQLQSSDSLGLDTHENLGWQRALWRRIAHDLGIAKQHPSEAFFAALTAMGAEATASAPLPRAVHVFCLSDMPALYLAMLRRLSSWIDLRLYILNPCREYWAEIVDPRRLAHLARLKKAEHHELGNRLLASWAKPTRDFMTLLFDSGEDQGEDAVYEESGVDSILGRLQDAILNLVELEAGSLMHCEGDRSVEVHVCHSAMREVEVLQDQLLALFAGDPSLRPSDVLVLTPELEGAAALIHAVFGTAPRDRRIPYQITGLPLRRVHATAQALLALLDLASSRVSASRVFALLEMPMLARRFGLGPEELSTIHAWIRDSGMRWGLDAEHRRRCGLPAESRHSLSEGLDRLFLGYAMPADCDEPVNGCLPAGDAEGSGALALGAFNDYIFALEQLQKDLAHPKRADDWLRTLSAVLDRFTAPEAEEIYEQREIRARIAALHADLNEAAPTDELPLAVVLSALRRMLDEPLRGAAPSGALTFAALGGLRRLPYRVVCAFGLNDGVFPTVRGALEFDLMALWPRRGDLRNRDEDRNVFLELVLSARERLYLSYTGRSALDNTSLPPSVLLAELLDYLAVATSAPQAKPAALKASRDRLLVHHPLQPFACAYFARHAGTDEAADARLHSFDKEYCEALRQAVIRAKALPAVAVESAVEHSQGKTSTEADGGPVAETHEDPGDELGDEDGEQVDDTPRGHFFARPLRPPDPEFRSLSIEALTHFLLNPSRYLLRARLAIELVEGDEALEDSEVFYADQRAARALSARLLPRLLKGEAAQTLRAVARAGIEYPVGSLGDIQLEDELKRLERFADAIRASLTQDLCPPMQHAIELRHGGQIYRLSGSFSDLRPSGLVRYRDDVVRPRDYLRAWVMHLFLNTTTLPADGRHSLWYSSDGHFRLPPVNDARARLEELVGFYAEGLRSPLHFYPRSAWAYVQGGHNLAKAKAQWEPASPKAYGEGEDPYYRLALRGADDPLDAAFMRSAAAVFGPLMQVIDDVRLSTHE